MNNIPDYPEYEFNKWYDADKHERPKRQLVCRAKNRPYPFTCWPNADYFICHASGVSFHASDIVRWMAVDMFEEIQ